MSVTFTQSGRDREVVEAYQGNTEDSCSRCLTKGKMIIIAVAKMDFTLCDNCYEYFLNKLQEFSDRKFFSKFAFWRKKNA